MADDGDRLSAGGTLVLVRAPRRWRWQFGIEVVAGARLAVVEDEGGPRKPAGRRAQPAGCSSTRGELSQPSSLNDRCVTGSRTAGRARTAAPADYSGRAAEASSAASPKGGPSHTKLLRTIGWPSVI